jgi:hypothetical protein
MKPHFGHTLTGKPVHLRTLDYHPVGTVYARFNKKVAIGVTKFVGSMTCAWIFCALALVSLPAVLTITFSLNVFPHWLVSAGLIALVAWIAQTFLQLVLLSIIIVGSNLGQAANDARSAKQFEDTEVIADRLNLETQGGLRVIEDHLDRIEKRLGGGSDASAPDG